MTISREVKAHINSDVILRYKQRLMAIIERFDADLALCLSNSPDGWFLVAAEGKLFHQNWTEILPYRALESALEQGQDSLAVDCLGEEQDWNRRSLAIYPVVSVATTLKAQKTLCFVAAKAVSKGIYQVQDLEALSRFLDAFSEAGF